MDQKEQINQEKVFAAIQRVETEVNRVVVGQDWLIRRLLIGLFLRFPTRSGAMVKIKPDMDMFSSKEFRGWPRP